MIEIIQSQKGFWDPRDNHYHDRIFKQRILETIKADLENQYGFVATTAQISNKWQSLKNYFSSCHQKYVRSTRSGVDAEEVEDLVLAPEWAFYEKLSFLREKMKTTPSVNSFNLQNLEVCK